ncbi:MAG: hypothetical protein ABWY64_21480 [Tardiphaga sp.]
MAEFTSDEKVKNTAMSLNDTVTTEIAYACALLDLNRQERIRVLIELCQHVLEEINEEISAEAAEEAAQQ